MIARFPRDSRKGIQSWKASWAHKTLDVMWIQISVVPLRADWNQTFRLCFGFNSWRQLPALLGMVVMRWKTFVCTPQRAAFWKRRVTFSLVPE